MKRTLFLCLFATLFYSTAQASDSFTPLRGSPAYEEISAQEDAILRMADFRMEDTESAPSSATFFIDYDRAYRVYLGRVFLECNDPAQLPHDLESAEYLWHIPVRVGMIHGIAEFCRAPQSNAWELQSFFTAGSEKSLPDSYADAAESYALDPDAPVYFIYGEEGFYIRCAIILPQHGEPLTIPLPEVPSYYLGDLPNYSGKGPFPLSDLVRLYQIYRGDVQAYLRQSHIRFLGAALFTLAICGGFLFLHKRKKIR